mgnify:CR=1 FL=1
MFDTREDFKEVEKVKERDAMEDFDKVLEEKGGSSWQ